jgi:hypothetical protein
MLKDRETGDCQVAPTEALRPFPPRVLPTIDLSRLIHHWWRPVALPLSVRPITISVANWWSPQAGGKSRPIASAIAAKLHQNCTRIAPELHHNCTTIAPELQQNPSNCTQLQQNHIGVGGGRPFLILILIIIPNPNLLGVCLLILIPWGSRPEVIRANLYPAWRTRVSWKELVCPYR